ncbi:hypothetical protein MCJ35_10520 [Enterocloster sp. OA13]|uniref:hypothetical protein n=1 Tax=Enterocloster sp. OA13 TaxID=2914161 RepID=UPI0004AF7BF7|nr:hypothetical protein [Enterocloster sp. OA13]
MWQDLPGSAAGTVEDYRRTCREVWQEPVEEYRWTCQEVWQERLGSREGPAGKVHRKGG